MTVSRRLLTPVFQFLTGLGILLATLAGDSHSAIAAERLTLQFGSLKQTINIAELETFAKTGKLSNQLQSYQFVFTPTVQEILQKKLHVDAFLAEQFLQDLFRSTDGERLLKQLNTALPDSTPQDLKTTLSLTLQKSEEISVLSFLQAYPSQNLTLNLVAVMEIVAQFNTTFLQSQILSPRLTEDLRVKTLTPLPSDFFPEQPGTERVYKETKILKDNSRQRKIIIDIYSSFRPQGPLVVMSHGFAADRRFLQYLAYHLASHGFTVVSVEHPGSNIDSLVQISAELKLSHLLSASEFIERPKDISFVLDELKKLNQRQGYLSVKYNTDQVTIIGHSFGGYTALALAGAELNPQTLRQFCQNLPPLSRSPADWLQCAAAELPSKKMVVKDRRIVQAIVLNPIIGHLFNQDLSSVTVPVLILCATEDGITPPLVHQLQPFQQLRGEKYLLVAAGATHMSATDISYLNSTMGQSTLVREVMDEKADPVRKLVRGMSLAFIGQLTPMAQTYQPYLKPTYAQSLSSQQIELRMTKHLPSGVKDWMSIVALSQPQISIPAETPELSWIEQTREYIAGFEGIFSTPEYHTERLESVFYELLEHSDQELNRLS